VSSNATATIYWQPRGTSDVEMVTLPWLTELEERVSGRASLSRNGVGSVVQWTSAPETIVRVGAERFGNPDSSSVERQLYALEAHLQSGGVVGFSRRHAKTWSTISAASLMPARGDTTIYGRGNGFTAYNAAGTLAVGDEVVIEAVHPDCRREVVTVGSLPVDPPIHVLLSAGCVNSYAGLPAIYRYRWFWPILRMADPGAQIVTSERRMNFTLSVDLLYQPGLVLDAWSVGRGSAYSVTEAMSAPDGASLPSLDRVSMADILAASRRTGIPSRTPGAWPP
jgi:hypothetical protein